MANSVSNSVPVLKAMWRLVQRGASPHVAAIARESALTPARVRRHLCALHAAQLIDWRRQRLTLPGLALAVACSHAPRTRLRRRTATRRAALPTVMLPVVTFRGASPANVTGIGDRRRV